MYSKIAFIAACVAGVSLADEFSRNGSDLAMVILVQGPALETPSVDFKLAADPAQNFETPNRITPMGQRQQFLIGSELRRRYVEEAGLLNKDYIISQAHLQTPFVGTNILSTQALMMGLYPESDQNDLTEWQQGNAVPPIEGADFSEWQQELGAKALPFGLNTFPITQTGFEDDMMLSLGSRNCNKWSEVFGPLQEKNKEFLIEQMKLADPEMWEKIQGQEVEFCDYLFYLDNNAIEIESLYDKKILWGHCLTYALNMTYDITNTNRELDMLMTGTIGQTIEYLLDDAAYKTKKDETADPPLVFASYQILDNLMFGAFVDELINWKGGLETVIYPASSNIIIEVSKNKTIQTYVNDERLLTKCSKFNCPVAEWIDTLTKRTNEQTKAICLESTKELDFIQQ